MKRILQLSLVLLLLGSLKGHAGGRRPPAPQPEPTPSASVTPTPQASGYPITLRCNETCTARERAEVPAIQAKMNETLMGNCLEQFFLKSGRRFDHTTVAPIQIVAKLREATTLTLDYYSKRVTRAVGYESASDFTVIHFNRAKLGLWSACDKASLGGHEFSHTKSFWHMGNKPGPNYYSVPYQVNHAFEGGDGSEACCVD